MASIVLADDDEDLRAIYAPSLRAAGHSVREAPGGLEALEAVREHRPTLLILDVWMPRFNGFEVLAALRHDPASSGLKIMMLSNLGDADTRLECFEMGAADYLVKGASPGRVPGPRSPGSSPTGSAWCPTGWPPRPRPGPGPISRPEPLPPDPAPFVAPEVRGPPPAMPDDYQESLDYLYGRLNYERLGMPRGAAELRLGRMRRLLRRLGDPHRVAQDRPCGGDQGKGLDLGHARRLALGLGREGPGCSARRTCTGWRSDSGSTGREATARRVGRRLVEAVRPEVEALDAGDRHVPSSVGRPSSRSPPRWGCSTSPGKDAGVVVLEVGMGGRLDSTNVVRPILAVLTTISFDHTRQLGATLGAIAGEKAGILKRGRPVVSGVRGDEASEPRSIGPRRLRGAPGSARSTSTSRLRVSASRTPPGPPEGRLGSRSGPGRRRLAGDRPADARRRTRGTTRPSPWPALDALADQGDRGRTPRPSPGGSPSLNWPARVEVIGEATLAGRRRRPQRRLGQGPGRDAADVLPRRADRTLIFGTTREKDLPGQLEALLLPLADVVVASRYVENPRSVPPEEIADAVRGFDGPGRSTWRATPPRPWHWPDS